MSNMVIFLDIDGVLNREQDWVCKYAIHEPCVKSLSEIAKKLGCCEIILSSTWRACDNGGNENEPDFYKNLKNMLRIYGLNIAGVTPVSSHSREDEILYYAKRHECGKYLVIDDDQSMFNTPSNIPLYICNHKTGLTSSDINSAFKAWKKYWK